ncbi:MAG: DUF5667 domain-containing protein, partial [Patescibacteria group bacterium]
KNNKIFLILALGMLLTASPILAQEDAIKIVKSQEVTTKDLGVSDPGMLPGNPFYFLKEWGREVKISFSFKAVKKAETQLQIVNERAAEIKKLKDLLPASNKSFVKSLDNYQKSIDLLNERIEDLSAPLSGAGSPPEARLAKGGASSGKGSSSLETDVFLNQLADSIIKQIKLFSEIKDGVGDKNKAKISELQEKITQIIADIPSKMETANDFKCRLEKVIKNQSDNSLKEITISEILDRFNEKMSKEARIELLKIKENLLIKFQSRLQSEDFSHALSEIMSELSGDSASKVKILDEIKEVVSDGETKNKLNLVRQNILDEAVINKQIRSGEAEKMIEDASVLLKDFQESISATTTPKSVIINSLFAKAKFNLEQARQALELNNYGQAFGQASASSASSSTGLNYISKFNLSNGPCAQDDLTTLKEYYDEVVLKMRELGIDKKTSPEAFDLFEKSERSIAKISDLIKKNTKADTLISLLKDSKLLISQLDNILADMLNSK